MEVGDGSDIVNHQKVTEFISAEELVAMRKSKEEGPVPPSVGPKLATPTESWLEEKAVECALDSYRESLSQKRANRICDLMQAEWKEELHSAVTSKLKGKFIQHMGHFDLDGQILLTPEESLFLVENGCLEVVNGGGAPMSVEEATSVMLKGRMAVERYRVYAHLSQLGFIVVPHHKSLKNKNEKKTVISEKEKKRKRSSSPVSEKQKKKLTFEGAFSKQEDNSATSCDSDKHENIPKTVPECDDSTSINVCDSTTSPSAQILETLPDSNNFDHSPAVSPATHIEISQSSDKVCPNQNESKTMSDKNISQDEVGSNQIETKTLSEEHMSQDSSNDCQFLESSVGESVIKRVEQVSSHSIEELDVDSLECMEVSSPECEKQEERSENRSQELQSTDTCNLQETRDEDADCVSCSSDSPSSSSDSDDLEITEAVPTADDEVALLEVTKKETTPLAVIDLLSDEENQVEDQPDQSRMDEDIEIVQVQEDIFKTPLPVDNIKSRKLGKLKSEQSNCENGKTKLLVHPPNCLNKELVCIPRPPLNLLPLHVQPHKEAYILDIPKMRGLPQSERTVAQPTRVWNSYRDMQEYQRSRRRHQNQNRPHFRQHNRNGRPYPHYNPPDGNHWQPLDSFQWRGGKGGWSTPTRDSCTVGSSNTMPDQKPLLPNPSPVTYESILQQRGIPPQSINPFASPQLPTLGFGMGPSSPMGNFTPLPPMSHNPNFINEVQRTAYTYARSMISSMFGPNFDASNLPCPLPSPLERGPNLTGMMSPINQWNGTHNDRHGMGGGHRNRQHTIQFPGGFRSIYNKRSWSEVSAAVETDKRPEEEESGDDIQEIPIDSTEFLWNTNGFCPLTKPGNKQNTADLLTPLRLTKNARMTDKNNRNEKYLPDNPSLEISYDVYLPGVPFKKSSPGIPKYRILVLRSQDPIPRFSEIAFLQRQWQDGASLQIALVDGAIVSFYSFASVTLSTLLPP